MLQNKMHAIADQHRIKCMPLQTNMIMDVAVNILSIQTNRSEPSYSKDGYFNVVVSQEFFKSYNTHKINFHYIFADKL